MDARRLIDSLERTSTSLSALLVELSPAEAAWKPAPNAWSITEIAGHLLEEERDDFRARLRSTLENPAAAWAPIDPEAAVVARGYARRDPGEVWAEFLAERRASLAWLRSLDDRTDWSATHEHPRLGALSAGDLLTSWAAHDLLHLRQIAVRLHALAEEAGAPHGAAYAGPL